MFAQLFNTLTATISNQTRILGEKVAERTSDLEASMAKLSQAQETMYRQEKWASIGQLAAGVAHEINNPTGYILSNLHALKKYIAPLDAAAHGLQSLAANLRQGDFATAKILGETLEAEAKTNRLERILDDLPGLLFDTISGTERIRDIVRGLQIYARQGPETMIECDVNEAVKAALKMVWNRVKYNCRVIEDYGDIPHTSGAMPQLEQVFINLIVNVADAIGQQGTITIHTYLHESGIRVEITDTGDGMDETTQNRIFEPFSTAKDIGKGTGMGWPISLGIINQHSGTIEVQSTPNEGTLMRVILPVRLPEEPSNG